MGRDNIFDRMIKKYNLLTKSEAKVADYVLKHKLEIQYVTISELAGACGVAEATVTRFCHSVGGRGFNEFKLEIAQSTPSTNNMGILDQRDLYSEIQATDSIEQKCQKLCHIGTQALEQTLALMAPENICKAVDLLWTANSVYCFGQGNSSIVAMDAWGRFTSITPNFHWISDSHMQANTSSLLNEGDVVLYFSFSGATRELIEVGELIKNTGAHLILVTRYPNSPGAAFADLLLICGANESPLQQRSIAAKIAQLFIIDVLFNEFCSRDLKLTLQNREKTLNATVSKLL